MKSKTDSARGERQRTSAKIWLFRLILMIGAPLLFFGGLELVLRVFGYGYNPSFFVRDETDSAYLRNNNDFTRLFFPTHLARTAQPLRIAKAKPTGSKRILVFGGSAAMGDPEPAFGLARCLQALLELAHPSGSFEVINLGITAVNSHVVLELARQSKAVNADTWVVYLGNNEVVGPFGASSVFGASTPPPSVVRMGILLKKNRTGQWLQNFLSRTPDENQDQWRGMEMFLEQTVAHDDPAMNQVYTNFEHNLRALCEEARSQNVSLVLCPVYVNLERCAPFASLHRSDLTKEKLSKWQGHFDRGIEQWNSGQAESARTEWEHALAMDDEHADLRFRLAACLQALQDKDAEQHFRAARNLDALRFRADERINTIIRQVASEEKISTLDADNTLGADRFYEHVHLRPEGNIQIARWVAAAMEKGGPYDESHVSSTAITDRLGLTSVHRRFMIDHTITRLGDPPFNNQSDNKRRLAELRAERAALVRRIQSSDRKKVITRLAQVVDTHPQDAVLRQQFARLLSESHRHADAAIQWGKAVELLPHDFESHYELGAARNRARDRKGAEKALRTALELRPDYATAWRSLGICLSHQERFKECYEAFANAVKHKPPYAGALYDWALVLAHRNQRIAAIQKMREAVRAEPAHAPARQKLGLWLAKDENYIEAVREYREVAKLLPREAAAHINLAMVLLKLGKELEAETALKQALELDPGNRVAKETLTQLQSKQ